MTKPRIAVLGLGIMGHGIADNFVENGYDVTVWNRSPEKTRDLADKGASVADSPAKAAQNADIIFDVTAGDESSRYVFCDEHDGIFSVATSAQTLITCATLTIAWTQELAQMCADKNITFFDMPMTGSRTGAESGNLTLLTGGDEDKLNELRPTLEAIAGDVQYFGEAGNGMKFKLVLNAIQAAHVIAFGDAIRQANAVGLDTNATGELLGVKPGGVPTAQASNSFINPPEQTNFSVNWILKDLKYAREMLAETNFKAPISPTILEHCIDVYQKAADAGLGDKDWTIVNA